VYSKEESARLRKEFWVSYGKSFPRKWLLYNTKIKDLSLKFYADRKIARVMIDVEMRDEIFREAYFEKFLALKSLFLAELSELIFDKNHQLPNGKIISRIYVEKQGVSIHNKQTWREIYMFFNENMNILESLFVEYKDFIKDV